MAFLLDTNVLAELGHKPVVDQGVRNWFAQFVADGRSHELFLSVLVVGEIRSGIEKVRTKQPQKALSLEAWLTKLEGDFQGRLLPVTQAVADRWGRLSPSRPIPAIDGLLCATALVHGFTLVTRNVKDCARSGVVLLNPFSQAAAKTE